MTPQSRPCEICGRAIEAERAELLADTRLCLEHARQIQKYGGEFLLSAVLERTSKQGSLKQNYGGVTPRKRRNYDGLARLRREYEARRAEEAGGEEKA
jgi:hypothetical protein